MSQLLSLSARTLSCWLWSSFVLGLAIGGIIFLIKQHNIRQRILAGIPHEKLETIREYAKSTMAKGFTKEQVKKALIDTGWQESQADALLHEF